MPSLLVVEDGTAKADANTFVTYAQLKTWLTARGLTLDATEATVEADMVRAADYLRNEERFPWRGTRKTATQTMPWPRTGASERGGQAIGSTDIPWRVKEAQMALVLKARAADLQPALDRGGKIASESVSGATSVSYQADASPETVYPDVTGILEPLLRCKGYLNAVPYQNDAEVGTPYEPGEYNNT